MNVAAWSGSLLAWENELSSLKARRGPVFCRRELRGTGGALLDGLLSGIACKIGWMMSGQAALAGPCGSRVSSTATAGTRTLCATNAMVPSVPELRFLFAKLLFRPPVTKSFVMQWTLWRRRHRAGTSRAHYKRRKKCNFSISNVTFRILYYGFFVSGKSPFQIAHVRSCGCGTRQRPRLSCETS